MKKKKSAARSGKRREPGRGKTPGQGRKRRWVLVGSCCLMVLLGVATVAGPWASSLGSRRIGSLLFAPPLPLPSPGNPSKEYIYGGGKLIATEEPYPLAAPANLVASTVSNVQINVSWTATAGADHYQVERANNLGGTFTVLNANVAGTSFTDNTVSSVNAYLYRVKAADAVGNLSATSNLDLATAIVFDDDPFPEAPTLTTVKVQHVVQLRQAVNAARAAANLAAASWSQNPVQANVTPIMANDIEELRTKLDEALTVLQLPTGGYSDSPLSGPFKKIHIKELRDRVK